MTFLENMTNDALLTALIFSPILGVVALVFVPAGQVKLSRFVSLTAATLTLLISLVALLRFESGLASFQFLKRAAWLPDFGIQYIVGIDGVSLSLILLTTFLTVLVIIASESIHKRLRSYLACMLLLEVGVLGALCALDGITFYLFWEVMLVPMYFLIGVWGGQRRIYAAIKFVIFTAFGSLLMLVAIVYLAVLCEQSEAVGRMSFALEDWVKVSSSLTWRQEIILFSAFALAFAIKIPMFPLHTWLPDAHVEAPTGGSVILAGVLLKLGLYGIIRFCVPVFPHATVLAAPLFAFLAVIGIVFGALVAWVQTDMKKLVAYSSVSHLGFCVLGFSAMNLQGIQGSVLQMINHGISTGALFFLVGVLYDRKHTRLIADYGGLAVKLPVFSAIFLVFTLSSIGLPLTNGFVGEFLTLVGGFLVYPLGGAIAVSGVVLGAVYMLSLYRRVIFGKFDEAKNGELTDLTFREKLVFAPLLILVFVLGVYPQPVLNLTEPVSTKLVAQLEKERVKISEANGEQLSLVSEVE